MADMMVIFLQDRGYTAAAPRSADAAIDHLEAHAADVVLLEPQFGGANDVARATAGVDASLVLLDAAPVRFSRPPHLLQKPFSGRQLLELLEELQELRSRRSQGAEPAVAPVPTAPPAPVEPRRAPGVQTTPASVAPTSIPRGWTAPASMPPTSVPRSAPAAPVGTCATAQLSSRPPGATGAPPRAEPGADGFNPFTSQQEDGPQLDLNALTDDTRQRASAVKPVRRSHTDYDHKTIQTSVIRLGNLDSVPLSTILYKLFASHKTGVLDVVFREQTRRIFIREGVPVYATSDAPSEQLESILVRQGVVSLPDLHRARNHMGQRTLSETLLALDLISTDQLLIGLDRQVFERILACFGLRSGNFAFQEETAWIAQVQHFPQNVVELLFEGVRRHGDTNNIAQSFGDKFVHYALPTARFEAFRPYLPDAANVHAVLEHLTGEHTLQAITQKVSVPLMEVLATVYALELAQMIVLSPTPGDRPQQSDSLVPTALRSDHRAARIVAAHASNPLDAFERRVVALYSRLEQRSPESLLGVTSSTDTRGLDEALELALATITPVPHQIVPDSLAEKIAELREVLADAHRRLRRRRHSGSSAEHLAIIVPNLLADTPTHDPAALDDSKPAVVAAAPASERPRPLQQRRPPRGAPLPDGVRYASAEKLANMALRKQRDEQLDTTDPIDDALAAIVAGEWQAAYRAIERVDNEKDVNARVVVLKAWIVYNLPYENKSRQSRICRDRLQFALTLDPAIPEGYYYLGRIAEDSRDLHEAVRGYEFALKLSPGFLDAQRRVAALKPQLPAEDDHGASGFLGRIKGWLDK